MKVAELAARIEGTVDGDGTAEIRGVAGLKEAQSGDLSFLANPRYGAAMADSKASAVIVSRDWKGACRCTLIRVDRPDAAFAIAAVTLAPPPIKTVAGIHPTAIIAGDVVLGEGITIGPYCVLEPGVRVGARTVLHAGCYLGHGATIGDDGLVYAHVMVREHTRIGDRVIIHSGTVIGSDGFGYTPENGRWKKIPQIGHVEIGHDVELGANVAVDRARFGKTVIGDGVKIDNLVQVAHNVRIGEHSVIAGQCGLAGSVILGKNIQFGGQVGVVGHLTVGDGVVAGARTLITKDIDPGEFVSGTPAMNHNKYKRLHAHTMKLPELREEMADVRKRLALLEQALKLAGGA